MSCSMYRHQPGRVDGIYRDKFTPISTPPQPPMNDRCEPISDVSICSQIGYNQAFFPNFRLQRTPAEASAELSDFTPLFSPACSNAIAHLLCSVYAPMCYEDSDGNPAKLHPCAELCEYVGSGCREEVESFGLEWPEHLECHDNPIFKPNSTSSMLYCPNPATLQLPSNLLPPTTTVDVVTTSETPSPQPPAMCVTISSIPTCSQIGYQDAMFPNYLRQTALEANTEMMNLMPLIDTQCSSYLLSLLCSVNAPFCYERSETVNVLPPCAEMCHHVKSVCEPVLSQLYVEWPAYLNCSDNQIFRPNSSLVYCPANLIEETTPTVVTEEIPIPSK